MKSLVRWNTWLFGGRVGIVLGVVVAAITVMWFFVSLDERLGRIDDEIEVLKDLCEEQSSSAICVMLLGFGDHKR